MVRRSPSMGSKSVLHRTACGSSLVLLRSRVPACICPERQSLLQLHSLPLPRVIAAEAGAISASAVRDKL
jgi:hypothetical protein